MGNDNMKILMLFAAAFLLIGCEDRYRYPCQDPENAEKTECNRPVCEADGMCYDTLNGLPPKQESKVVEEIATPAEVVVEEHVVVENTGE
jgi:hypothetical protein